MGGGGRLWLSGEGSVTGGGDGEAVAGDGKIGLPDL